MRRAKRRLGYLARDPRLLIRRKPPADRRDFLLELLPRRSAGAEIGVWRGDFSARILEIVRPARLHLIDPWAFETDERYGEAWYGGGLSTSQEEMDAVYEGVRRRFADEIAEGVVVLHRAPSADVGPEFEDESLDWVYIDGNHLYEFVRRDLEIFGAKVRRGGLVAGDDYGVPGWWEDGVTRAVDELAATGEYEVLHLSDQFALRKL